MAIELKLDFTKETSSKSVLDILRNGLRDDPKSKLSYEECLSTLSQGKKLTYGAANHLLSGIVRALHLENSPTEDEFVPGERFEDVESDPTMSQILAHANPQINDGAGQGTSSSASDKSDESSCTATSRAKNGMESKQERENKQDKPDKSEKKTKALCRFYNNGKCKHGADCRFLHPKICPKFRQHGDCKTKGCQGGCEFLHPNVCRTSLKDRTCTYPECKFFHLKGTKVIERKRNVNASSQNWRAQTQNNKQQGHNQEYGQNGANNTQSNNASKNRQPSLNARTKKKSPNPNKERKPEREEETREESKRIERTLEAIMKRLDDMEAKPGFYPLSGLQLRPQIQPMLSPAVPQPGTQTQYQWASQPPWTPSQTQYNQ